MNLLVDRPPQQVEVCGRPYRINSGHRAMILFELLMRDPAISERDKTVLALQYFYPDVPDNAASAFERLLWFYRCGKEDKISAHSSGKAVRAYDFEQDGEWILSIFQTRYCIDLTTEEVHWWRFMALLRPLLTCTDYAEIVRCRSIDTRDMSKEQRKYYGAMRRAYGIRHDPIGLDERERRMHGYVERRFQSSHCVADDNCSL